MPSKPKVWIVCAAGYVSGKEITSLNLAEGLRERNYDVNFVTSRWNNGDFQARLSTNTFPNKILPLGFISKSLDPYSVKCTLHQLVFWPALALHFNSLVKRSRNQVIVHTNWHHALLLLPFLDQGRDILWLHETVPKAGRYAKVFSAIAKRTKCIVCVSEAVARSLRAIGIPKQWLTVI